jgi:RNA polymerase sigma-70 factor (ECF subfamily)
MIPRLLHVLHVLVQCQMANTIEYLFYPHRRWSRTGGGEPYLALPTKKVATADGPPYSQQALRRSLAAIFREELGKLVPLAVQEQSLTPVVLALTSPSQGVETGYTIQPVVVRVAPEKRAQLSRRLGGRWLTPEAAASDPCVSPTAQHVFRRLAGSATTEKRWPPQEEWTERLLHARYNDRAEFGRLFTEMEPWLVQCLRLDRRTAPLCCVTQDVEEIVQDTALRALTHLDRFDPFRGSAPTWLGTIARNTAISILRRRSSHHPVSLFQKDGSLMDVPDGRPLSTELVERQEELDLARAKLERVLALCDPRTRRIWELRHCQGMPYARIAEEMDEPQGTIATIIHRVRRQVRAALAAQSV